MPRDDQLLRMAAERDKAMADLAACRAELAAEKERAESLERDLATQVYRGNSVSYWHDKAVCYGNICLEVNRTLNCPGKDIREEAEALVHERDTLTAQRDRLAGLLRKGKRNMSAEQLHEWQMQTDAALSELNPPTPTAPTNGEGEAK